MTNEEFQLLVLQELKELKEGQKTTNERLDNLEAGQKALEAGQKEMNERFDEIINFQRSDIIGAHKELQAEVNVIGAKVYRQELRNVK